MSTAAIPDSLRPRLGQIVRLIGSDRDGEVLSACAALKRTLGGVGLDLHDLAATIERPPEPLVIYAARPASARRPNTSARPTTGTVAWPESYRSYVRATLERGLRISNLTEWEEQFVRSVLCRLYEPNARLTNRQAEVVSRLLAKIGATA